MINKEELESKIEELTDAYIERDNDRKRYESLTEAIKILEDERESLRRKEDRQFGYGDPVLDGVQEFLVNEVKKRAEEREA